nr:hypothetical protein [Scandinavium goeteborgense]
MNSALAGSASKIKKQTPKGSKDSQVQTVPSIYWLKNELAGTASKIEK